MVKLGIMKIETFHRTIEGPVLAPGGSLASASVPATKHHFPLSNSAIRSLQVSTLWNGRSQISREKISPLKLASSWLLHSNCWIMFAPSFWRGLLFCSKGRPGFYLYQGPNCKRRDPFGQSVVDGAGQLVDI